MLKGFNSDISVRGISYHIQTEDWGAENPFLVTRIFCQGAVFKTIKISHADALKSGSVRDHEALRLALKAQHHRVVEDLTSGILK